MGASRQGSPTRSKCVREQPAFSPYPAGLVLAGRKVLVVGGGQVAQRRIPGLLTADAQVTVVSPQVTPSVHGMVVTREVAWLPRRFVPSDLDGAWYVIAATDDRDVNATVAEAAEARHIFCVRSDDASRATAWTPATGRHGRITVAVLASRDPRRSAAVRDAVVDALRRGDIAAPRFRAKTPGVVLVGGGPGDPDLITVAGRRALSEADVVVADHLAPRELLDELPAHVELVDAGKLPRGSATTQDDINATIVSSALAGQRVVRLKGGDPFVFGRGYEELLACAQAGVPCTVIPGITSAISVPALAGVPLTHRGVAQEFTVVSGHLPPEHPESLVEWSAVARLRGTVVLMMAMANLAAIARELIRHGRSPDAAVAVVSDGSRPTQRALITTLESAAGAVESHALRPPAVVVIGDVVSVSASAAGHQATPEGADDDG
jgi:uroporphyrin-III C-methyltransferase / precorrin-2 dehydrogenase / sirohydrochlorin ferrochelatase